MALFDLLGKVGNKEAIQEAAAYLGGALFKLYRQLYRAGGNEEKYMAVDSCAFNSGAVDADLHLSEAKYAAALEEAAKDGASFPDLGHDAMNAAYPGVHQSALQVFHAASARVNTSLGKK